MHQQHRLTVLYDADCSLCQAAKSRLQSADKTGKLDLVPLQDPQISAEFPNLSPQALSASMHVVYPDGRVFTGAAAYREIGRIIWPWSAYGIMLRLFRLIVMIPGILPLSEKLYAIISNNRYRLFPAPSCQNHTCSTGQAPRPGSSKL